MGLVTYRDITVEPFEIQHIQKLRITKKPNEHTRLFLTGILAESLSDSYVQETVAKKTVKVKALVETEGENGEGTEALPKTVFSGIIERIEVAARANTYYITVEAVSHSMSLDVEKIRRSYQTLSMSYETLMKTAVQKYAGADVMCKIKDAGAIGKFILQYNETAWAFVKRMASRFNAPLIVEDKLDEPKIYAGLPDKDEIGALEDFAYRICKDTDAYRRTTENFKESAFESDFIFYEIVSEKVFEIANKVNFKGRTLYVNEVLIEMADGVFQNIYKLTEKKGFRTNLIKSSTISGLSLEGTVVGVEDDKVKILLDIDLGHPPEEYCLFKYSTPYTSNNGGGFYCMPEINEKVTLYLPDNNDENAYSTNCVRGDGTGNPDIKYWRTAAGKEIVFSPNGVRVSCVDGEVFISLITGEGILVQSNKTVNIIGNEGAGIKMYAEGQIVMAAEKEFDAFCNGSRINMKNGVTKIRGYVIQED